MNESILESIKKLLGIPEDVVDFDTDMIININSVFMILNQLGVGAKNFSIQNKDAVWTDFLSSSTNLESVKSYVYLKVRTIFDPPQSSIVMDTINRIVGEFEWRLNVETEGGSEDEQS